MVLAGSTADDGRSVGERLCAAVRIHAFGDGLGRLTLSMGSASAPEHGNSFEAVVTAATSALQRIQSQGRDGAGAAPLHHHEALRRPLSIDRLAGRVQELASLTRWLDEAFSGQPRLVASTARRNGHGNADAPARIRGPRAWRVVRDGGVDEPGRATTIWSLVRAASRNEPLADQPTAEWRSCTTSSRRSANRLTRRRRPEASIACSAS